MAAGVGARADRGGPANGRGGTWGRGAVRMRPRADVPPRVHCSALERVTLSGAWLDVSEDANIAIYRTRNTCWKAITEEFQKRMAEQAAEGAVTAVVAAHAVAREAPAIEKYWRKLSANVMQLVVARIHVENADFTGNPAAADLEFGIMANYEGRDKYEANRAGRYEVYPTRPPESRAIMWLDSWHVLSHSPKFRGAAAAAAHAARRRRFLGAEGEAAAEEKYTEVWDVDSATETAAVIRQKRAALFRYQRMGVMSVRTETARKAVAAAAAGENKAGFEAMGVIAGAVSDESLAAIICSPALRDEPRFKYYLGTRADEMIAARISLVAAESRRARHQGGEDAVVIVGGWGRGRSGGSGRAGASGGGSRAGAAGGERYTAATDGMQYSAAASRAAAVAEAAADVFGNNPARAPAAGSQYSTASAAGKQAADADAASLAVSAAVKAAEARALAHV